MPPKRVVPWRGGHLVELPLQVGKVLLVPLRQVAEDPAVIRVGVARQLRFAGEHLVGSKCRENEIAQMSKLLQLSNIFEISPSKFKITLFSN